MEIISESVEQTIEIGREIGRQLRGGEVIAVYGQLGSGKTHLIKGIAEGCGAGKAREVISPTFVIVNEYRGRLDVYHIDAYRLEGETEFEMLGFDEYCYAGSVVVIEWADKIEKSLRGIEYIRIRLSHRGEQGREILIENLPPYILFKRGG